MRTFAIIQILNLLVASVYMYSRPHLKISFTPQRYLREYQTHNFPNLQCKEKIYGKLRTNIK